MRPILLFILFLLVCISCDTSDSGTESEESLPFDLSVYSLSINEPEEYTSIGFETVRFSGQLSVEDSLIDYTKFKAKWYSDVDGLLQESNLYGSGHSYLFTDQLSKAIHSIRLDVINENDSVISDSIYIYNAVKILPIEKTNNANYITWCNTLKSNFESYELYRSENKYSITNDEPIYKTTNVQDTTFVDSTARIGRKSFYKVVLKQNSDIHPKVGSNIDSLETGQFIRVNYPILKVIPDLNRNMAYGIINTGSLFNTSEQKGLIFINLETFEVESRILTDRRFWDLDMDPDGEYLYLCTRGIDILKVNLNSRTLESTLILDRPAHKVEIGTDNRLYYHITPPSSGSTEFRVYDLLNEENIPFQTTMTDAERGFRHGDMELDSNNVIYHGESNSSFSTLSKIGTTDDIFSLGDTWEFNNYGKDHLILNNDRIFWNHNYFDMSFNLKGSFYYQGNGVDIDLVSPNNSYAIGSPYLFRIEDGNYLKQIPANFNDGIFVDDTTVLLHNRTNPYSDIWEGLLIYYSLFVED